MSEILSPFSPVTITRRLQGFLAGVCLVLLYAGAANGQSVPEQFANNAGTVQWYFTESPHIKLVYPERAAGIDSVLLPQAEAIYKEYRQRLGTAPRRVTIYYNDEDELVSGLHARDIDDQYSVWYGDPLVSDEVPGRSGIDTDLRVEMAYAFREHIRRSPVGYWYYPFYSSGQSPWSDGFLSYLATPEWTSADVSFMRSYRQYPGLRNRNLPVTDHWYYLMLGRSQLLYFNRITSPKAFRRMYGQKEKALGILPYFDFGSSFTRGSGIQYRTFYAQWLKALNDFNTAGQPSADSLSVFWNDPMQRYRGAALSQDGRRLATISIPVRGSELQQLRVGRTDEGAAAAEIVSHGYFHRQMAWSPDGSLLVYAKRTYEAEEGFYYHRLHRWDADKNHARPLTPKAVDARHPTISGDGTRLAYTVQHKSGTRLMVRDIEEGIVTKVHTFGQGEHVEQVDYHPDKPLLLVSFRKDARHEAATVHTRNGIFTPLALEGALPLNAAWDPAGTNIYFNRRANGVSNLYRAGLSASGISNAEAVDASSGGLELWDVAETDGGTQLIANDTGAGKLGKIMAYRSTGDTGESAAQPEMPAPALQPDTAAADTREESNTGWSAERYQYNALRHTTLEPPFMLPYYISPDDFGVGAYITLKEPLRTHEFDFQGVLSLADPLHKSFFYTDYENNSFRPKIEVSYNHFSSDSEWFGKSREAKSTNIVALSSLWKIREGGREYSDWYAGVTLRHMAFDFYPEASFREHHPDIYLQNRKTRQTDLRLTAVWRSLKPNRHNLIHPTSGTGMRFSVTASDKVLGSLVRYARLNLDGYTVLPAIGDDRIYIYANGAMDVGEAAGRDYLSFADNGDYQLPGEDFMGSINPGLDRFVRGYTKPLVGSRFLFGKVEYRMPFQFNTSEKLLGFLPPARTSLTVFADGGIMGEAITAEDTRSTIRRYSTGAEIKRILSFGGSFKLTYELGLAQPLNRSFSPVPYYNIKAALPF